MSAVTRTRGHAKPEDAARAWGRAHGIVNRGGSLYWDAETRDDARALAAAAGLSIRALERRARWAGTTHTTYDWLVTGYQARPSDKGWADLAKHLIARGRIAKGDDGRYRAAP